MTSKGILQWRGQGFLHVDFYIINIGKTGNFPGGILCAKLWCSKPRSPIKICCTIIYIYIYIFCTYCSVIQIDPPRHRKEGSHPINRRQLKLEIDEAKGLAESIWHFDEHRTPFSDLVLLPIYPGRMYMNTYIYICKFILLYIYVIYNMFLFMYICVYIYIYISNISNIHHKSIYIYISIFVACASINSTKTNIYILYYIYIFVWFWCLYIYKYIHVYTGFYPGIFLHS